MPPPQLSQPPSAPPQLSQPPASQPPLSQPPHGQQPHWWHHNRSMQQQPVLVANATRPTRPKNTCLIELKSFSSRGRSGSPWVPSAIHQKWVALLYLDYRPPQPQNPLNRYNCYRRRHCYHQYNPAGRRGRNGPGEREPKKMAPPPPTSDRPRARSPNLNTWRDPRPISPDAAPPPTRRTSPSAFSGRSPTR